MRWLTEPDRLSPEQARVTRAALRRGEPFALSGVTLVEIVLLYNRGRTRSRMTLDRLFAEVGVTTQFRILPIDFDIAKDLAFIEDQLRDPWDATIVATARVHN